MACYSSGGPCGRHALDPITPQNAVLLLIDQQEGLLARVYESEQMRGHLLGLARGAQLLGVPVVMTEHGGRKGGRARSGEHGGRKGRHYYSTPRPS